MGPSSRSPSIVPVVFACVALVVPALALAQKPGELPITTSSTEARDLFLEARDLVLNVEGERAAPLLDRAIKMDPAFALAHLYRFIAGGAFTVVRPSLEKAEELADRVSPGERLLILGLKAGFDGHAKKAGELLDQLLKTYPNDRQVVYMVGLHYFQLSDYANAQRYLEQVTTLDPNFAAPFNQLGYATMYLGRYDQAERAFKRYIELRPNSPNPYDSYAEMLLKTGRFDESIVSYRKALEKDPEFLGSMAGIGHAYVFKGEFNTAREWYQKQFERASDAGYKTTGLYWTAVSYVHEGLLDQAVSAFDRMRTVAEQLQQVPEVANADHYASLLLTTQGSFAPALQRLDRVSKTIQAAALTQPVKENLGYFNDYCRTFLSTERKQFAEARANLDRMRALATPRGDTPRLAAVEALTGHLAFTEGNDKQAIEHLAKANADDMFALFTLATVYERSGDMAKAHELYAKVARWNQNDLDYALVRAKALQKAKPPTE